MTEKICRINKVIDITTLSRSSIYEKITEGTFPAPVKLGERAAGWFLSDIEQWMAGLKADRPQLDIHPAGPDQQTASDVARANEAPARRKGGLT